MAEIQVTPDVLNGLGAKVETLDLTEAERAVLETVLRRAADADAEVEGFGVVFEIETKFKGSDEELQALAGKAGKKWGDALGFHIHVNP